MTVLYFCSLIPLLQLLYSLKSVQLLCRSMSPSHRQTLSLSLKLVTSQLLSTSLSEHALLNASRRAAKDFCAQQCSRTNKRSAHGYTMFAPAQRLRN
jgi:hypothetical protein